MSKIKIINAKVNKKLIGDEVTYKKISASKINPIKGGDNHKKPKQPSLRDIVVHFIERQEQFNNEQREFNKKQEQVNEEQKNFNTTVIATLKEHGEAIAQLDGKVDNVIKLNNLKS